MGTKTLANFQTGVTQRLQNRTDITTAQLTQCINNAYDHVTRPNIYDHREMHGTQDITLTATVTYALNSAVDVIRSVYNVTKGQRLDPRDIEQFDGRVSTTARPTEWAVYGTNLILGTIPDSGTIGDTVRIRYWKFVTLLSATTDTTAIHARWDDIIEVGAAYYAWSLLGNIERMAEARDEFARLIRDVPERMQITGKGRGFRAYPNIIDYQRR